MAGFEWGKDSIPAASAPPAPKTTAFQWGKDSIPAQPPAQPPAHPPAAAAPGTDSDPGLFEPDGGIRKEVVIRPKAGGAESRMSGVAAQNAMVDFPGKYEVVGLPAAAPKPPVNESPHDWARKVAPAEAPTQSGASLRGFVGGALKKFGDELAGTTYELGSAARNLMHGVSPAEVAERGPEDYRHGRDTAREDYARHEAAFPKTTAVTDLAGNVASDAVLNAVAPGGGVVARGATLGGVQGLGQSEADLTKGDVAGALADTGKSAAVAGAMSGMFGHAAGDVAQGATGYVGNKVATGAQKSIDGLLKPARDAIEKENAGLAAEASGNANKAQDLALKDVLAENSRAVKSDAAFEARIRQKAYEDMARRKAGGSAPSRSLDDEIADLERQREARIGQGYQSDYQAEHVYGDKVPDTGLEPSALDRRRLLETKMQEVANRRLQEPLPEARAAEWFEKAKADLMSKRGAGGPTPPEPVVISPEDLKAEVARRIMAMRESGVRGPAAEPLALEAALKEAEARLAKPEYLKAKNPALARKMENPPSPKPMPSEDELARELPEYGKLRAAGNVALAPATIPAHAVKYLAGIPSAAPQFSKSQGQYAMSKALRSAGRGVERYLAPAVGTATEATTRQELINYLLGKKDPKNERP